MPLAKLDQEENRMREMIVDGVQLVEETTVLSRLTLKEGARLTAPEGKFVQLTVDLSLIHI